MYEQNKRHPYPSDLSDEEWEIIEPYIPIPQTICKTGFAAKFPDADVGERFKKLE